MSQLGNSIEKYDDLRFALSFGNKFQCFQNNLFFLFIPLFCIQMINPLQSFILLIRIQFHNVVVGKIILNEPPEILFVSSCRCDQKLYHKVCTLACEVLMNLFFSKSVTSLSESSFN